MRKIVLEQIKQECKTIMKTKAKRNKKFFLHSSQKIEKTLDNAAILKE